MSATNRIFDIIIDNSQFVLVDLGEGKCALACKKCNGAQVVYAKRYNDASPCTACKTTGHQKRVFETQAEATEWCAAQAVAA